MGDGLDNICPKYKPEYEKLLEITTDILFEQIDTLLTEGRFDLVDQILEGIDIEWMLDDLLVGYLSITLAASHELKERAVFYEKVEAKLGKTDLFGLK